MSKTLTWLARGPKNQATKESSDVIFGYVINGLQVHTNEAEKYQQDSGISLEANTINRASARDSIQVAGKSFTMAF